MRRRWQCCRRGFFHRVWWSSGLHLFAKTARIVAFTAGHGRAQGSCDMQRRRQCCRRGFFRRRVRSSSWLQLLAISAGIVAALMPSPPDTVELRAPVTSEHGDNVVAVVSSPPCAVEVKASVVKTAAMLPPCLICSPPCAVGLRAPILREDGGNVTALISSPLCAVEMKASACCEDGRNVATVLTAFSAVCGRTQGSCSAR